MTVALWTIIALAGLAGAWRAWQSETPGVEPLGIPGRTFMAVMVGLPAGAGLGFLAALAVSILVGPPA